MSPAYHHCQKVYIPSNGIQIARGSGIEPQPQGSVMSLGYGSLPDKYIGSGASCEAEA